MRFAPMTRAWAQEIAAWRYPGFYAVYNLGEDSLPELLEGRYAAALGEDGELRGFCCWGAAAQVPAAARQGLYPEGWLDIGLGRRPQDCGQGSGAAFVREVLAFAGRQAPGRPLRLTVMEANLRARKAYAACGFAEGASFVTPEGVAFLLMTAEPRSTECCAQRERSPMERQAKHVYESRTEQIQILMPGHINGARRLFGGRLMEWIDVVAAVTARRHAASDVTTASVDRLVFEAPALVNSTIILQGQVTYVGRTSMEVRVDTFVEALDGRRDRVNRAYLVLVALGEDGAPREVPRLLLDTEEERREWEAGKRRRDLRLQRQQEAF